jgi:hypothetical protein
MIAYNHEDCTLLLAPKNVVRGASTAWQSLFTVVDLLSPSHYQLQVMPLTTTIKVEGAKTNTPSKTNIYKRLPISNI